MITSNKLQTTWKPAVLGLEFWPHLQERRVSKAWSNMTNVCPEWGSFQVFQWEQNTCSFFIFVTAWWIVWLTLLCASCFLLPPGLCEVPGSWEEGTAAQAFCKVLLNFRSRWKCSGFWRTVRDVRGYFVPWLLGCFTEVSRHGDAGTKHGCWKKRDGAFSVFGLVKKTV